MQRRCFRTVCLIAFLALIGSQLQAQERFAFHKAASSWSAIPAPDSFLGYAAGDNFTFHADVLRYLRVLAEASDRVVLSEYGKTHEGRILVTLTVTAPENHARIDEIRQANLALSRPGDLSAAEIETRVQSQPVVQWLSYNIHGNEASSTEAALQVAYHLATADDPETLRILKESVVILDPCINPDGRDRYVYGYRTAASHVLNENAVDFEHDESWPGGRTNHYWFDLNRDWVWGVHPESQGRIRSYQTWMPQVHVDYHEQGYDSNYFTMPGTTPRNQELPAAYETWADYFGTANARAFDREKINYFTREAFDFFYPGYGSSYPSVLGAIGMLTEQGGGGRGGRAVKTTDGYVLTLRQRIYDHYLTSMTTLRASVERRKELLNYFVDFFKTDQLTSDPSAAFILPNNHAGYTADVIRILLNHGVEVEQAETGFTAERATDFRTETASRKTFEAGTFLVRTNQPRHVFVRSLLQQRMAIDDSVMYDMSTWSMPLAYNLDASYADKLPRFPSNRVVAAPGLPSGVSATEPVYAWVIDWSQQNAPKALAELWKRDYRVRSVSKTFTLAGKTYPRGSLVVLAGRNLERADRIASDMNDIAASAHVEVIGFSSGRTEDGIDLASSRSVPLKKPRVALMVDSPFSSYTAGQIWYLFDYRTRFGIDRVRMNRFPGLDLNDYDVVILPGGGNGLGAEMDSVQISRLGSWIKSGGTLIAVEGAATWVSNKKNGLVSTQTLEAAERAADKPTESDPYVGWEAGQDSTGLKQIPGTAFRSHLDITHPLAYGMNDQLYSIKLDDSAFTPGSGGHTVGYYERDPEKLVASGYASAKNINRLAGKAWAVVQASGRGNVVLLADNTQYRMFWLGPARLLVNGVMLVPSM